jgi:hypothetical protein
MRNSIQSAANTYLPGTVPAGARRARHLGSGVTVMLWLLTLPFSRYVPSINDIVCVNSTY